MLKIRSWVSFENESQANSTLCSTKYNALEIFIIYPYLKWKIPPIKDFSKYCAGKQGFQPIIVCPDTISTGAFSLWNWHSEDSSPFTWLLPDFTLILFLSTFYFSIWPIFNLHLPHLKNNFLSFKLPTLKFYLMISHTKEQIPTHIWHGTEISRI